MNDWNICQLFLEWKFAPSFYDICCMLTDFPKKRFIVWRYWHIQNWQHKHKRMKMNMNRKFIATFSWRWHDINSMNHQNSHSISHFSFFQKPKCIRNESKSQTKMYKERWNKKQMHTIISFTGRAYVWCRCHYICNLLVTISYVLRICIPSAAYNIYK